MCLLPDVIICQAPAQAFSIACLNFILAKEPALPEMSFRSTKTQLERALAKLQQHSPRLACCCM